MTGESHCSCFLHNLQNLHFYLFPGGRCFWEQVESRLQSLHSTSGRRVESRKKTGSWKSWRALRCRHLINTVIPLGKSAPIMGPWVKFVITKVYPEVKCWYVLNPKMAFSEGSQEGAIWKSVKTQSLDWNQSIKTLNLRMKQKLRLGWGDWGESYKYRVGSCHFVVVVLFCFCFCFDFDILFIIDFFTLI